MFVAERVNYDLDTVCNFHELALHDLYQSMNKLQFDTVKSMEALHCLNS